jgi:hypothetical protein
VTASPCLAGWFALPAWFHHWDLAAALSRLNDGSSPAKRFGVKLREAVMRTNASAAVPFLGIGTAFTAVGASGRHEFLAIGLAFSALGILFLVGKRSVNNLKLASDRDGFDR